MDTFSGRDGASRVGFVVVLLGLAAAILALLADQARRAVQSYRVTTERILADYATLAASNYALRTSIELEHYAFIPPLEGLTKAAADRRKPDDPTPIEIWTDPATLLSIDLVRTAFHMPRASGEPVTSGEPFAPAVRAWLADTLRATVRNVWHDEWSSALLISGSEGALRPIVYAVGRDSLSGRVWIEGFEAKLDGLGVYFDFSLGVRPLLPPALTQGVPQDSLVSVAVLDPARRAVFRSARQYESRFAAEEPLGPRFGGMTVRAVLHPDAARVLVFEGPPRTQLPLLGALFVLAVGLLGAALFVVRREAALARQRSDFVASVSHELRTPIAQIRLFGETLRAGRVRSEEERSRSLEIIDQESRRLAHLVENVLHVARAERPVVPVDLVETDLAPLVADIVQRFAPLAAERRARIEANLEPRVRANVDVGALRQMITNLLDNAVKYGSEGQTVRVTLSLDAGTARFAVADEGPGIAPRDREAIWRKFVRLDGRSARSGAASATTGAGIGLAVVRDLAQRHGGRAWVEDRAGGGAAFVVALPAVARAEVGEER